MTTSPQVQKVAEQLVALRRDVRALQVAPRLAYSSIEDGAVQEYDREGQLVQRIGKQFDGTHVSAPLSGPTPPTPAGLLVEEGLNGVWVTWEGLFVGDAVVPMDFARVEIHSSEEGAGFSAITSATLRTTFETPRGGRIFLAARPNVAIFVKLVTRSLSGKPSPASAASSATPRAITTDDLAFDPSDFAGTTIWYGAEDPVGAVDGDLWLKEPENVAYRRVAGAWEEIRDQGIVDALQEARAAQADATQAGLDALAAQGSANTALDSASAANSLAQLAKNTADAKVAVYRQTSPPTGLGASDVNDLWLDTDDGNKLYAWSGSAWVLADDQRTALALSTAQGKTTIFAQVSAPSSTGRTLGDQWIDTDDGNKIYVWDGAWTARAFGAAAISATARQLGAVTTYRQATAPAAGMIVGDFWVDSDDNRLYRYEGATPSWVLSQDVGIQQALTAAGTAQTTANGKTTTFYQVSAPAATGRVVGDLWVDTDDGNKIYTWNGAWTVTLFSASALALGDLDNLQDNPGFENGLASWTGAGVRDTAQKYAGTASVRQDGNGTILDLVGVQISSPVDIEEKFYAEAWVRTSGTSAGTVSFAATSYTPTFVEDYPVFQEAALNIVGTTWKKLSGVITLPVGVSAFRLRLSTRQNVLTGNSVWWDNIIVRRMVPAGLISATARQLGAITTYRQSSAPSAGMILGDFWIDADDNVLYRYEGATPTWVKVQDANIISAVNAAATAQATADGKVRIFPQASPPSGLTIDDIGDTWIDTDDRNKSYRWDNKTFVARTNYAVNPSFEYDPNGVRMAFSGWDRFMQGATRYDTLSYEVSAPLIGGDGSKMARIHNSSALPGALDRFGVLQQIVDVQAGDTFRVQALVGGTASANQSLTLYADYLDSSFAIIGSYFTDAVADNSFKLTQLAVPAAPAGTKVMRVYIWRGGNGSGSAAPATLYIDRVLIEKNVTAYDTYFDGSSGTASRWSGAPHMSTSLMTGIVTTSLQWIPNTIGTNSIQPKSLVASDVIATGTVSAGLLESVMVLTNMVIAGNPRGNHARLTQDGLSFWAVDPDGMPEESGRFGTGADRLLFRRSGQAVFGVDETGSVSCTNIDIDGEVTIGGNTLQYMLDQKPGALLVRGGVETSAPATATSVGLFDVEFTAVPGRAYRIHTSTLNPYGSTTTTYHYTALTARRSSLGAPTVAAGKPLVAARGTSALAGAAAPTVLSRVVGFSELWEEPPPSVPTKIRVLLVYGVVSGGGTVELFGAPSYPIHVYVEDAGPEVPFTGVANLGGGTLVSGGNTAPPPTSGVQTYQQDFASNWAIAWTSNSNSPRLDTNGELVQGYTQYAPQNGIGIGQIGFPDVTAALAGATVNWGAIYIYASHWFASAGGTGIVGHHQYLNPPATKPADWALGSMGVLANWPRAAGRWIYLQRNQLEALKTGNTRGFTLGDGASTLGEYYGRFTAVGDARPVLRLNYTK